ncbi:MAG: type II CRISPR-associated endonuclease Cas1 [Verrucomicrobiia bacterium]
MSYHIVNIDAPQCSISCKDGQLVCKTQDEVRSLPLEDVASIIVTSFSAVLHSNLILEAAKYGVTLIICEAFKPVSLLLPANRSTDTLLTRALINTPEKFKALLWRKTIDAKCKNQLALCEKFAPDHPKLHLLKDTATSRIQSKEATCAKLYWQIIGTATNSSEFKREREGGGMNNLLNYGYAVLLSTILQKLFALGLDPTFGISHVPRERSVPLAYDLMEPFRPCVDWRVIQWINNNNPIEVTKEFRKWVTGFVIERVEYFSLKLEIRGCIECVLRGFRRAIIEQQAKYYRPWYINKEKIPDNEI